MSDPLPEEIDEALWQEACRRAEAIRKVVKDSDDQTSAADIADLSKELGLSRASVFRLIKLFRESGTVMSLADRKRGRRTGHRALDAAREKIVQVAIKKYYLKQTRPIGIAAGAGHRNRLRRGWVEGAAPADNRGAP